ncbi:MAG: hypothetical protein M3Y49_07255 [Actinomycetota bacterium]|nr:hypothetical protein [Actinomycetota bacterium]
MDSDTAGLQLSPHAYSAPVQAGPGSPVLVGPAYLATMDTGHDEMLLSSHACGDLVHLLRDGRGGAARMMFNGTSPHYNDGQVVMGAVLDMEQAAAILQVAPEELAPVVAAAGRALGAARTRVQQWQTSGLPPVSSYAQLKAIADGTLSPPVAADAAVTDATAFVASQLHAAGDGRLRVTDPVLHTGAGTPSATITGPDGSLDLRVDRLTGASSVHLVTPGFPQHGTSDPIDTQLGVNLGATVIGIPDADLAAVVQRAAPILRDAQRDLDADTVRHGGPQPSRPLDVPEEWRNGPRTAAQARASFQAGGSAVTQELARLAAKGTPPSHRDDRPHHMHGGPAVR